MILQKRTATPMKEIMVWLDDATDLARPVWIVAPNNGEADTMVETFPGTEAGYAQAIAYAEQEARDRGLTVSVL